MPAYSRPTLKGLAEAKLQDAQLLFRCERYSNAYYLGGYAVEIGLKAVITLQFTRETLPDRRLVNESYTHNLKDLVRLAGLESTIKADQDRSAVFAANWAVVATWDESSRYTSIDAFKATEFFAALSNETDGVFPWLRLHW